MKWICKHQQQSVAIDINEKILQGRETTIVVNNQPMKLTWNAVLGVVFLRETETMVRCIRVRNFNKKASYSGAGWRLQLHLPTLGINLQDVDLFPEYCQTIGSEKKEKESGGVFTSPITGKVVKLLVKEGDRVKEHEAVAIIEAMKMENRLETKFNGIVKQVHLAVGQTVHIGEPIVSIEPKT